MRYAGTRYREHQRDVAYRIYVSEALRIISENTARFGGGTYMKERFSDVLGLGNAGAEETRTREEVIGHVFGALKKIRGDSDREWDPAHMPDGKVKGGDDV